MISSSEKLGSAPIKNLLLQQSVPASIGFLVMSVYQMVDVYFVSQYVGKLAIGAINIVLPITFLISALGMAIGIGGGSVISRALGAGDKEKALHCFGNQTVLTLSLTLVFAILGWVFNVQILRLFGANEEILPFALSYYNILLIGIPFLAWAMMSNNVIRAEGKPKMAMLTLVIPAVANLILDPILIAYFDMGVAGAAWATTVGYIFSGIYTLAFFLLGKSELSILPKHLKMNLPIVKEISSIGSITLVRQASFSVMAIVLNNSLNMYGGSLAIAIYGILRGLTLFVAFPNIGVMQGMMPIVGYNYGANSKERVIATVKTAVKWTTLSSLALFILIMLFAGQLTHFFTPDADLRASTPFAMRITFLSLPLMGLGFIAGAYFQAINKTRPALFLTLARQGLFIIPLVLIFPMIFGINGIWFSFPVGELLAAIVSYIWLKKDLDRL